MRLIPLQCLLQFPRFSQKLLVSIPLCFSPNFLETADDDVAAPSPAFLFSSLPFNPPRFVIQFQQETLLGVVSCADSKMGLRKESVTSMILRNNNRYIKPLLRNRNLMKFEIQYNNCKGMIVHKRRPPNLNSYILVDKITKVMPKGLMYRDESNISVHRRRFGINVIIFKFFLLQLIYARPYIVQ